MTVRKDLRVRRVAMGLAVAVTATLVPGQAGRLLAATGGNHHKVRPPALHSDAPPRRKLETQRADFSHSPPLPGQSKRQDARGARIASGAREIPGLTSETRKVYENPDGSRTAVISSAAARVRHSDGSWEAVDLQLEPGADGLETSSSPVPATIPTDPLAGAITAATPVGEIVAGYPLGFEQAAKPELVTIDGADVAAAALGRGRTSLVQPLPTGFEQSVRYDAREDAVAAFNVALQVPASVHARAAADGIELVDERGAVVGTYGGGAALDAGTGTAPAPVRTFLIGQEGQKVLARVSVAPGWLESADREYPVTIDPTFTSTIGTTSGGGDTYVNSGAPTTSFASATDLRVGKGSDGSVNRSFVKFGLGGIPAGAVVLSANLRLYNFEATNCTASTLNGRELTSGFGTTTTWNSQPTNASTVVATDSFAHGATGCAAAWEDIPATAAVQDWFSNGVTNNGLRLNGDESSTAGYKRFKSSAAGSSVAPQLVVTYDQQVPIPSLTTPADGATVLSTQPQFTASTVTDPDGDTVKYWFRVWTNDSLTPGGQVVDSGWLSSPSWTPPAEYLVDGGTYSWTAYSWDQVIIAASPTTYWRFSVNSRLGDDQPSPYDTVGPVQVNLATGNAVVGHSSPTFTTVGGAIGVPLTYNSQAKAPTGLTGTYRNDTNANQQFDDPVVMTRLDPTVNFSWRAGTSPSPAVDTTGFLVRWTGKVTVPTTGTYWFGATNADGVTITVNGTQVHSRWPTSFSSSPQFGSSISLTANTPVSIQVDLNHSVAGDGWIDLQYKTSSGGTSADVPTTWLTPSITSAGVLPTGWSTQIAGAAGADFLAANVVNDSVSVTQPKGEVLTFARSGEAWTPPTGERSTLTSGPSGGYTLISDAVVYEFGSDGRLLSATAGASAASPQLTYTSTTAAGVTYQRLTSVTDPVSSRSMTLAYNLTGTTCPTAPSGFDAAPPTGMLCKAAYWDGTETDYFYVSGQLARIVDPGGSTTDYAYNGGVLTKVRDPLAYDAVSAGVRSNTDATRTLISYSSGKVTGVQQPEPTSGAARPEHTFAYPSSGTTTVDTTGITGHILTDTYDDSGRETAATDVASHTISTSYVGTTDSELLQVQADGTTSSTIIDPMSGLATDGYGPADQSLFDLSTGLPASGHTSQVPHTHLSYDENVAGLSNTWWPNTTMTGAPTARSFGLGSGGSVDATWSGTTPTGTSAFSGSMTGVITFTASGTWSLRALKSGNARIFLDDKLIADGWDATTTVSGSATIAAGQLRHRLRIEYSTPASGTPAISLKWTPPGGSEVTAPGSALNPDFGNVTTAGGDASTNAVSYGSGAAQQLAENPVSTTVDPSGSALGTNFGYETPGTGRYDRVTSRTLPGGNSWSYDYYGAGSNPSSADDPCTAGTTLVNQGGGLWKRTGPSPASGVARLEEFVRDAAGRVVAHRIGSAASWSCTSYDARGRLLSKSDPAFNGQPAHTVTYTYSVSGDPTQYTVSDGVGTITAVSDLLGRVRSTTDVWGQTTTYTYDQAARMTSTTDSGGSVTSSLNADDSVASMSIDGAVAAQASYLSDGRLDTVSYPSGTGKAGNGTSLDHVGWNADLKRVTGLTWKSAASTTMASDSVTLDLAGRVVDQSIDGSDANAAGANFVYDNSGRLTTAHAAGKQQAFTFSTSNSCGANTAAGANSRITSVAETVSGTTTTSTYCYDNADRLTSATGISSVAYDAHGNTTALGSQTSTFDSSDRLIGSSAGAVSVGYTRDALGRIVARSENGTTVAKYTYGLGSAPTLVLNSSGSAIVQRLLHLPGGVLVTKQSGGDIWSYPNVHGDILATANATGVKQGSTIKYDAYGAATAVPDNALGGLDFGWLAGMDISTDHVSGLTTSMAMGQRQYDSTARGFLSVDSVEGGSANDYDYVSGDPVNSFDPTGTAKNTCGYVTCTTYFNRSETRQMRNKAGILAVLGTLCATTGFIPCAVLGAIYGIWAVMAANAYSDGRCLKIKWPTMEPGSYKRYKSIRCR